MTKIKDRTAYESILITKEFINASNKLFGAEVFSPEDEGKILTDERRDLLFIEIKINRTGTSHLYKDMKKTSILTKSGDGLIGFSYSDEKGRFIEKIFDVASGKISTSICTPKIIQRAKLESSLKISSKEPATIDFKDIYDCSSKITLPFKDVNGKTADSKMVTLFVGGLFSIGKLPAETRKMIKPHDLETFHDYLKELNLIEDDSDVVNKNPKQAPKSEGPSRLKVIIIKEDEKPKVDEEKRRPVIEILDS